MPARLTPEGLLCTSYVFSQKRWQSEIRAPAIADLLRITDLQPGLTIGDILGVVEMSSELMTLLGQVCWCETFAIHLRPRVALEELLIYPSLVDQCKKKGGKPTQYVILEKEVALRSQPDNSVDGFDKLDLLPKATTYYRFLAGRDDMPRRTQIASPAIGQVQGELGQPLGAYFAAVVDLPLRLADRMDIACDFDPPLAAETSFTLFEILTAIYYSLGEPPPHLNANRSAIECTELLREVFGAPDDEEDEDRQQNSPDA